MGWKDRVKTFQDRKKHTHEIPDFGEVAFYPNRISQLQQLRGLSETVMKCMGTLFSDNRGDADQIMESGQDEDGFTVQKTAVQAVGVEVLEYRAAQQREAIEELFSLVDRKNLMLIGEMLMDSMRDEFLYARQRGPQEIEEFLFGAPDPESDSDEPVGGIDVTLFVALMQGWIKGNSSVFGDVGEKLVGLVKGRLQAVSGSEGVPTNGQDSKTPSSPPSPTDGASNDSKN